MNARRLACGLAAYIAVAHGRSGTAENATPPAAARRGVSRQPVSNQVTGRPAFTHDPAIADPVFRQRRHRAGQLFGDGILLLRATRNFDIVADGFRQDGSFFYFTGLANTSGALLAIDGDLAIHGCFWNRIRHSGEQVYAGSGARRWCGITLGHRTRRRWQRSHRSIPTARAGSSTTRQRRAPEMPPTLENKAAPDAPRGCRSFSSRWPLGRRTPAARIDSLMAIQTADEQRALASAATATVAALKAGMRAIPLGVHQRAVEAVVENACWRAGAHGSPFWPWAMAGANAIMPRPFVSEGLHDHLDTVMEPGELVRLDVGCEWDHYGGDLGRTVPVRPLHRRATRNMDGVRGRLSSWRPHTPEPA